MKRRGLVASILLCVLITACGGERRSEAPQEHGGTSPGASPPTDASPIESAQPAFEGRLLQVSVKGRNVTPRLGAVDVPLGQKVRIEVTADTQDEIHVHGYDRRADLVPGQAAVVEFDADIPGSFEVELEEARLKLLDLRVR